MGLGQIKFNILAIGYSLEMVVGFSWESAILVTFCASPAPRSSRIVQLFGNLPSCNRMTCVSEFCSEILILLCERMAKIFCLRCTFMDFGNVSFF